MTESLTVRLILTAYLKMFGNIKQKNIKMNLAQTDINLSQKRNKSFSERIERLYEVKRMKYSEYKQIEEKLINNCLAVANEPEKFKECVSLLSAFGQAFNGKWEKPHVRVVCGDKVIFA